MREQTMAERIQKIVTLSGIPVVHLDEKWELVERFQKNAIYTMVSVEMRAFVIRMLQKEGSLAAPVIWEDENHQMVGAIRESEKSVYVTGLIPGGELVRLLTFLEMLDDIILNRNIQQKHIMIRQDIFGEVDDTKVFQAIHEDELEYKHYSYFDERELLMAVENGDRQKVFEYLERGFVGTMEVSSEDTLTTYRNNCIEAIIMCRGAVIRGGVPAKMAYEFGGVMMRQVEKVQTVSQMYSLICSVFNRYTKMVAQEKEVEVPNNITEQCRQYILAHYKEKITVNDIADYIGKSPNYISTLFKEKVGMSLNEYINYEKISAAKDLLKYSELDISVIANFLSYQSQAYFGKVFKKMTGETPKHYRDNNKVKELSFDTAMKGKK
jgi:AraC-like DNA-binding protein